MPRVQLCERFRRKLVVSLVQNIVFSEKCTVTVARPTILLTNETFQDEAYVSSREVPYILLQNDMFELRVIIKQTG